MSTKELKVWSSSHSGPTREMVDVIKLSDHLAAMAEKDATIRQLKEKGVQLKAALGLAVKQRNELYEQFYVVTPSLEKLDAELVKALGAE